MFVCRTRTRSRDGKEYFTFRLVRSQRVGDKVRQRTLLNLGSHFPIQRDHWRPLCQRVQRLLDPRVWRQLKIRAHCVAKIVT